MSGAGVPVAIDAAPAVGQRINETRRKLLFSLRVVIGANALIAVVVGAFIVCQTVTVAVRQRRRDLALLNAAGITRWHLGAFCLSEVGTLAALGVVIGLAFVALQPVRPLHWSGNGVRLVPLYGHTPGHVGVLIEDAGRCWLIAGDATFDSHQTRAGEIAGVSQDVAQARATQGLIARQLEQFDTVLLPAHDTSVFSRLPN